MADVVINIPVSDIQYISWLRSSYISMSDISEAGIPMINNKELGPDQEDALINFLDEAVREVAKLFVSRQGDVNGVPFEYDKINAIYRFNEETPVLPQASSLKEQLTEYVKNAIYSYISILWFNSKKDNDIEAYFIRKYEKTASNIDRIIYLLHD